MKEIKNPLVANIDRSNGSIEISLAKKYSDTEEAMYKSYMTHCATHDKDLVDTTGMDDKATAKSCAMQYDKMRAMMNEVGKGGLTEKQKKLPLALQKAILKKMKEEGKATKSYAEEKDFKPHKMYDPKTGKAYEAKTYADHIKMKKMGYTHEEPKVSKAADELPADAKKKLSEIAKELDNGVKAHASQAKRIRDML